MFRTCHCCGHTLTEDVVHRGGDCVACFAKITPLANGRIGYRVKAAAILAMPPHETVQ